MNLSKHEISQTIIHHLESGWEFKVDSSVRIPGFPIQQNHTVGRITKQVKLSEVAKWIGEGEDSYLSIVQALDSLCSEKRLKIHEVGCKGQIMNYLDRYFECELGIAVGATTAHHRLDFVYTSLYWDNPVPAHDTHLGITNLLGLVTKQNEIRDAHLRERHGVHPDHDYGLESRLHHEDLEAAAEQANAQLNISKKLTIVAEKLDEVTEKLAEK